NHFEAIADKPKQESEDWLFVAINHPAGALISFFLKALSKTRRQTESDLTGIPSEYKKIFSSVVNGNTYAAEVGRVVLASQLLFLFSADEKWAVENIVPLLRWSYCPRRALQAW